MFVARGRGTHKTPSPRKLTSYPTRLERYTVRGDGKERIELNEAHHHDACVSGPVRNGDDRCSVSGLRGTVPKPPKQ